jgi:cytochrome c oxidase cbb3-type subunit 2
MQHEMQYETKLPPKPPPPSSPRYRMTGTAAALFVTGPDGGQQFHIADPIIARATKDAGGPEIPWLSAEQAALFLMMKWVVQLDDVGRPVGQPGVVDLDDEDGQPDGQPGAPIGDILAALDRLGLAADAGAPAARKLLRENSISASNEAVCAAISVRKQRMGAMASAAV